MKNEQIILNEVAKLDPSIRHQIAAAAYSAEKIAAVAAAIDGKEGADAIDAAETILAAEQVHTFNEWKRRGYSVKKYEKALINCHLWNFTERPNKAQRAALSAEELEEQPDPHYYKKFSHLFSCLQVAPTAPAPRKMTPEELKAKNAALMAEFKAKQAAAKQAAAAEKAAKEAAEKAAAEKAAAEEAAAKQAAAKQAAVKKAAAVDLDRFEASYNKHYDYLYFNDVRPFHHPAGYDEAETEFDARISDDSNDLFFKTLASRHCERRRDFISSDREAVAFVMAVHELETAVKTPEMAPGFDQLSFC